MFDVRRLLLRFVSAIDSSRLNRKAAEASVRPGGFSLIISAFQLSVFQLVSLLLAPRSPLTSDL